MSSRPTQITADLREYLLKLSLREPKVLKRLRAETQKMPMGKLQITPEQGQFMALLVELTGAKRIFEVGTFTGYSSCVMALALPRKGRLVTCDISEEYTSVARRYWKAAGVAKKVDLRIGPAVASLDRLLGEKHAGKFDLGFLDADKPSYDAYYERALKLLRKGGLLLIDNVLLRGAVIDRAAKDKSTRCVRALNKKILGDERVSVSMLPIGDGLTLARKR